MVRLGLLSTAFINGAILRARGDDAPFQVAAVGSRDRSRAEAYALEHGIPRAHGSYEELLADDTLDAVYVALPCALHHEWTLRALAAGKHVLCEKPYTRRPEQVDEAHDLAEREGLVLAEAYMWRHSNQTGLLSELLPRVGTVEAVRVAFLTILPRVDDVRYDRALGGGAVLDLGCYCVSASRLVTAAEPDRVYAEAVLGRGGVDVGCAGTLRFGDVTATFQCGFSARANQIEVYGREGVLLAPRAFVQPPGVMMLNGDEHRVEAGDAYRNELDDFCAAVRGERAALLGRDDMRAQARVLDALLRSIEAGAPVSL
jgi:predicted dehydrogenase